MVSAQSSLGQALAGNIVLCSWAGYFTNSLLTARCVNGYWQTLRWTSTPSRRGGHNLETGYTCQPDGALGLDVDLTLTAI